MGKQLALLQLLIQHHQRQHLRLLPWSHKAQHEEGAAEKKKKTIQMKNLGWMKSPRERRQRRLRLMPE